MVENITKSFEDKEYTLDVFLDLSKDLTPLITAYFWLN